MAKRPNVLKGTETEGRIWRYVREALERRYNRRFDDLLDITRKVAQAPPTWTNKVLARLDGAAQKLLTRLGKAGWLNSPLLRKLDAEHWSRVFHTAVRERLRGNIKGAIREMILDVTEEMENLVNRMKTKVLLANAKLVSGSWQTPRKIRGAIASSEEKAAVELGDIIVVAFAGKQPPVINGKKKRIWLMADVESKSPTNKWDAFEQLRARVERIKRHGMVIDGVPYRPDEIHIDLPTQPDHEDWVTELVAALPRNVRSADRAEEVTKGVMINVWKIDVEESELDRAVKEVEDLVARELGDVGN